MNYIGTNVGAILAATVAGLVVGALFIAAIGRLRQSPGLGLLTVAFVSEFWLAAILAGALILAPAPAGAWTMAIGSAVVIWVGFVVPTLAVSGTFRGLPLRSIAADCTHWLLVMTIQAMVLHISGLTHP